jgi:hopanoid biosynthesis associated protein HpnK
VRRLIINADDFGLTSGINRAVLEGYQHGSITSATLMPAPCFEEAVCLAKSTPGLGVGCHVVLVNGKPVLDPEQVPTLAHKKRAGQSGFRESWEHFAAAALAGKLAAAEIEAEAVAQIRKLQSAGITVSHLDTHKHVHMFPSVLRPLLRAARQCGVRAIRNPFEPLSTRLLTQDLGLWKRWLATGGLNGFAPTFRQAVRDAGMATPQGSFGIVSTGFLDAALLRYMIERLPEGTWEFVCHPGYDDAQLQGHRTRLRKSREDERMLLISPETLQLFDRERISLISYRDLVCEEHPG